VGPPITELLPESGTETTTPPTMGDARLSSPPSLKRVDTTEPSQAAEGARAVGDVGSQRIAPSILRTVLGRTIMGLELELFFRRGNVKMALGYGDYLWGLRNSKLSF